MGNKSSCQNESIEMVCLPTYSMPTTSEENLSTTSQEFKEPTDGDNQFNSFGSTDHAMLQAQRSEAETIQVHIATLTGKP